MDMAFRHGIPLVPCVHACKIVWQWRTQAWQHCEVGCIMKAVPVRCVHSAWCVRQIPLHPLWPSVYLRPTTHQLSTNGRYHFMFGWSGVKSARAWINYTTCQLTGYPPGAPTPLGGGGKMESDRGTITTSSCPPMIYDNGRSAQPDTLINSDLRIHLPNINTLVESYTIYKLNYILLNSTDCWLFQIDDECIRNAE